MQQSCTLKRKENKRKEKEQEKEKNEEGDEDEDYPAILYRSCKVMAHEVIIHFFIYYISNLYLFFFLLDITYFRDRGEHFIFIFIFFLILFLFSIVYTTNVT